MLEQDVCPQVYALRPNSVARIGTTLTTEFRHRQNGTSKNGDWTFEIILHLFFI